MMDYYSGIGSRATPNAICNIMTVMAERLTVRGYILRSGGADGADTAFESGAIEKEIWLPWAGFNNNDSELIFTSDAYKMAETIHPTWNKLTIGAKKLHARNCNQILGNDLNTPSKFVICWTPNGKLVGGTATALRIANMHKIPIFNMGNYDSNIDFNDTFELFLYKNNIEL